MSPDSRRVYRTVYRRKRDVERFPDFVDQLPLTVYSSSDNLEFQQEDLDYLRSDEHPGVHEAWIETRIEYPWERLNV